jgi:hypothetical protein
MSETDPKFRYSNYAVWVDLNRALLDDIAVSKPTHSSYSSPITNGCIEWMAEAGEAIKINDSKTTYHYLWNIVHATRDAIDHGLLADTTDEWMKPYYEFNQAAFILLFRIENPAFKIL